MPILRVPKSIKWLFACSLFFLLLLSAYRLGIYMLYKPDFPHVHAKLGEVLWTGFRFDLRLVGAFTLFPLFLSFFPATHLFKTSIGKNTAFVMYAVFMAGLLFFYMIDFVCLYSFRSRLQGTLLTEMAKNTDAGRLFRHNMPWIVVFLLMLMFGWLSFLLVRLFHKVIGKKTSGSDDRLVRTYWQVLTLLVCIFGLFGRIGKYPLSATSVAKNLPAAAVQLALTPVESFFTTLPGKQVTAPAAEER